MNESVILQSKFLLEEYFNAEIDADKMRARAAYGYHDDRFQACNMALWAGHKWTYDIDRTEERVTENLVDDYQRMAPTLDNYVSFSDWKSQATEDWLD